MFDQRITLPIILDANGFPMVESAALGVRMSLWPVTSQQYAGFLATHGREYLPPVHGVGQVGIVEDLFARGISPQSAIEYVNSIGDDFDLPSAEEWVYYDTVLGAASFELDCPPSAFSTEAQRIYASILRAKRPTTTRLTWRDIALFRGGLCEIVRYEGGYAQMGVPDKRFFPNTMNPRIRKPSILHDRAESQYYRGVRLVQRRTYDMGEMFR